MPPCAERGQRTIVPQERDEEEPVQEVGRGLVARKPLKGAWPERESGAILAVLGWLLKVTRGMEVGAHLLR